MPHKTVQVLWLLQTDLSGLKFDPTSGPELNPTVIWMHCQLLQHSSKLQEVKAIPRLHNMLHPDTQGLPSPNLEPWVAQQTDMQELVFSQSI